MKNNSSQEKLIDIRKIYAIVRKNWMVMSKDSLRLRMLLLFPLVMIIIFGYTAGKMPTNVSGAIVDYDHTATSRSVQEALYATELFSIKHQFGSQDEGRNAIESGDIKILFIIPPGFEKNSESGKTATISVIVDESDPTVAQMTSASTQAIIKMISEQVKASRLSMISSKALQAQHYLLSAPCTPPAYTEEHMQSIGSNFADAQQVYSATNGMLSSTAQALRNSIGYVNDPNEALANAQSSDGNHGMSLSILATSLAKQQGLDQVMMYQAIMGANAKLYRDTATIYQNSNAIYANALVLKGQLDASCRIIGMASGSLGEIAGSTEKASSDAIVVSEIKPYGSGRKGLDFLIPSILALIVFQGAVMGMGRAIAGERKDGSLTRVFLTPTSNVTILSGTLLFYILFETVRSSLIVFIAMFIFGVFIKGSIFSIIFIIGIYAAGCTGMGMILSVMSKSQEQYMALAMLISMPTMFLAGVFLPIETMPAALQGVTRVLPVTYASDALRGIMIKGFGIGQMIPDVIFLIVFALFTLMLSVLMFKRELI